MDIDDNEYLLYKPDMRRLQPGQTTSGVELHLMRDRTGCCIQVKCIKDRKKYICWQMTYSKYYDDTTEIIAVHSADMNLIQNAGGKSPTQPG